MNPLCYCTLLRKATRRVSAVYDEALTPFGINIAQYALLRMVTRTGPVSLTELGKIAELDRSTIGRNVRVLERMGLMKTVRSEKDQREAMVTLTDQGRRLFDRTASVWEECQAKIEGQLGREGIETLNEILKAV